MALYSYCLIHMVLIAMTYVGVDNFNTDGKSLCVKRKCPYLHDEHYDTMLAAKRRMKLDDLADELGQLTRADTEKLQLPHFAYAFGKNVGLYEYSHFGTFDKCPSSQIAENNDGNNNLAFSRNVRNDVYYDVCTSSNPQELRNNTPGQEHDFNNPHNYINSNQTENSSQNKSQSYTNPDHYTLNSFGAIPSQLRGQNQMYDKTTIQIANLLMNSKWHDVPIDQLDFLNSFVTVEGKFNELIKGYKLLWQRTNQFNSAPKFNFGIINSDLKIYEIAQKRNPEDNLGKRYTKNDSQSVVSVPDFKTYYERCRSNLTCTTSKYIIFSQKWSNTRESDGCMIMYSDFSTAIARLVFASSNIDHKTLEIKMVCDKYFLDCAHVLQKLDNNNTRYNPADYIPRAEQKQKNQGLCVLIDILKYTLVNAKDYEEKFAIFKQFIFDIFFGKHPSRGFYTIREELWRLQMYMPEIYLYLTWRLTITINISVGFGDEEYGLKEEIENLADLVNKYLRYSQNRIFTKMHIGAMRFTVNKNRSKILAMLKYYYKTSAMCQFYKIAHESSDKNSFKNHFLRNRDILSMLAFAPKSESCESLSQSIINFGNNEKSKNKNNAAPKQNEKYQQNARNNMTAKETSKKSNTKKDQDKPVDKMEKREGKNNRAKKEKINIEKHITLSMLTNHYLGGSLQHKVEMLRKLQCIIGFFRNICPLSIKQEDEKVLLVALKNFTVVILMRPSQKHIYVSILSKPECYVYFHRIIYSLFASS